jgi:hypothetical protein
MALNLNPIGVFIARWRSRRVGSRGKRIELNEALIAAMLDPRLDPQ